MQPLLAGVCFDHTQPGPTVTTVVFNNNILPHPILNPPPPQTDLRPVIAGYQNNGLPLFCFLSFFSFALGSRALA